jgi:hypothetical protein
VELENIIFSEVTRFRKPKAAYFLSYVEYRANSNTSSITKKKRLMLGEVTNRRKKIKEGS